MNVVFHAATSFGIAHVAARGLDGDTNELLSWRDRVLVPAFIAGVLSHGVLDHGDNQLVSITNHFIVAFFAAAAVRMSRAADCPCKERRSRSFPPLS